MGAKTSKANLIKVYTTTSPTVERGLCREKHHHKRTDGREGRKAGREPKENDYKPRKPTQTQGACLDQRGTGIKALTVHTTASTTLRSAMEIEDPGPGWRARS
jgi:hypothetical protein